ncbi:NRDE family protein [Algoriphagus sp. H41]|uniref:NRDE family protein n=1 Tax=Algoriphagus oliviformis TaxID=2811231 RepID=A0ABS3CBV3_9BACT|nr:NRDE family protein [Algoriphagus oliviformis]MBN7813631.1 NRDE family protein [Algoriphagus oliviformis]
MCLVAFSWKTHPEFPLLISANRDEFFDRPTAPLHRWESGIYAGKDLRGGGTWMGFHPDGKWAFLTNYRDFSQPKKGQISRGRLVLDFLEKRLSPENYLDGVMGEKDRYEGFNLLVSDGEKLYYYSNYGDAPEEVQPGIHGISNALLNAPWPKTALAKKEMTDLAKRNPDPDSLLTLLKSPTTFPPEQLPDTGVPKAMEAQLSSQFIRMEPNYGTVSSTSVLKDQSGLTRLKERSFDWDSGNYRDTSFSFQT